MNKEDVEIITKAVVEAIDQKTKEFYVDREKHWKHHEFLDNLIDFFDKTKTTTWRAMLTFAVIGILGLLVMGIMFAVWTKFKTING